MNNHFTGSLRGEAEDSTVTIPISYIRNANLKLIERKYLLNVNSQKDSIINLQKLYINTQEDIYKSSVKQYNKKIKQQRNILYGSGAIILILAIVSIFK